MEVLHCSCIFLILIDNLLIVTGDEISPNKEFDNAYISAKNKFSKLLTGIADLNVKRLDALKKYNDLDWQNPVAGILRNNDYKNKEYLDEILQLNLNNSNGVIEEALHDKVCQHDNIHSPVLWLRHTALLMKAYNEVMTQKNDLMNSLIPDNKKSRSVRDVYDNLREKPSYVIYDVNKEILRTSCWRKSYAKCKEVCSSSINKICHMYQCSSRLKYDFKDTCKRKCEDKFDY